MTIELLRGARIADTGTHLLSHVEHDIACFSGSRCGYAADEAEVVCV